MGLTKYGILILFSSCALNVQRLPLGQKTVSKTGNIIVSNVNVRPQSILRRHDELRVELSFIGKNASTESVPVDLSNSRFMVGKKVYSLDCRWNGLRKTILDPDQQGRIYCERAFLKDDIEENDQTFTTYISLEDGQTFEHVFSVNKAEL